MSSWLNGNDCICFVTTRISPIVEQLLYYGITSFVFVFFTFLACFAAAYFVKTSEINLIFKYISIVLSADIASVKVASDNGNGNQS